MQILLAVGVAHKIRREVIDQSFQGVVYPGAARLDEASGEFGYGWLAATPR